MELIERVARAICCEGHQCAGERVDRKCDAAEHWSNEAKAAIRAMLDGVEPVAWRYHFPGDLEHGWQRHELERRIQSYEGMSCNEEDAGCIETPLYSLDAPKGAVKP